MSRELSETVQKSGIYVGKRVRFTVCRIWGNDRQNSGLVKASKFRSGIAFYDLPLFTSFNETRISVWNISSGNTGLPFQMFRCSRKFSAEMNQKVVFHLFSNRIFRLYFDPRRARKQSSFLCLSFRTEPTNPVYFILSNYLPFRLNHNFIFISFQWIIDKLLIIL